MKKISKFVLLIILVTVGGWVVYDKVNEPKITDSSNLPFSAVKVDKKNAGLNSVGSDIYNKTDTTWLILSYNNLKTLPSEMGKLTNLEVLALDHNKLEGSLIGEIRKMPLKTLDVSYNNFTGMPAEIGQLDRLTDLDYSYNKVTDLPNEITNLKDNLKKLNLSGNPLQNEKVNALRAAMPNTNIIF